MVEMTEEMKSALDEQKKQCPFCKIVDGEIPSKKVYEDDLVLAILDINPASKGHVLLLPKEHYPIMPYIPPDEFAHLFGLVGELSKSIKEGILSTGVNVFIANGWIAGQKSQHFMLHIIPREENDMVSAFTTKEQDVDEVEQKDAYDVISTNLPIMMYTHFTKNPQRWHKLTKPKTSPIKKFSKDQVIQIIEQNPQLKEAIIGSPQQFLDEIHMNDQLKEIFANVDAVEVIKNFNPDFNPAIDAQIVEEENGSDEREESEENKENEKDEASDKKVKQKKEKTEGEEKNNTLDDISNLFR